MSEEIQKIQELEEKLLKEKEARVKAEDLLNKSNARGLAIKQEKLNLEMMQYLPEEMKIERAKMNYQIEQANTFIKSGAFPNMNPEQAYVLIKSGEEMNLKPLQSMNDLYIVKGAVRFHGKGLVDRVVSAGYEVDYINEDEKGVDVKITNTQKGFEQVYNVRRNDKAFSNSKAIMAAPKNKMRYHGVRMIVSFYLPFLVSAAQVWDEEDVVDVTHEEVKDEPQNLGFSEAKIEEETATEPEEKGPNFA